MADRVGITDNVGVTDLSMVTNQNTENPIDTSRPTKLAKISNSQEELNSDTNKESKTDDHRTFVIIKPDAVSRGLVGTILSRFEQKGLLVQDIAMAHPDIAIIQNHYAEHKGKDFFDNLCNRMANKSMVLVVLRGDENIVQTVRRLVGKTDCSEVGTIRGDLGTGTTGNLVHASDSDEAAQRELTMWGSYTHGWIKC